MPLFKKTNSKQRKELYRLLDEQFGFKEELAYEIYHDEKNNIFIVRDSVTMIKPEDLKIRKIGCHFGRISQDHLELSIEGSEIIGPFSSKGIFEVSSEQLKEYLKGKDIDGSFEGISILKSGTDYLGTSKSIKKMIKNKMPKNRRILADDI